MRLVGYGFLTLAAAFAALVIGNLLYEHFSWAKIVAQVVAFAAAISSGDPPQIIAALTSKPVILLLLSAGLAVSLVLQKRRRSAKDVDSLTRSRNLIDAS
jgi:hypothetical protein